MVQEKPYSLLHDFRFVNYSMVDWKSDFMFFEAAHKVAKQGLTQSVALVITGCSPLLLSTVNAMLWMSPVQPAKVFAYHDEALNWCVRNTK